MYYTRNDIFTGIATAYKVLAELNVPQSNYRIIDGNRLSHFDTLWGWDARCWIYNHLLARLETLELQRADKALRYYRSRTVPQFQKGLEFEDGCIGLGLLDA
ncbi:lipase 1-like [Tropilaelaps mercedesae]|uniref:Lipase 1-like n=1 Tax=Tropilaelaps mercedesae TaxID=418985 RepID=A0A1V9X035_9ACAR|nr:lipase 1-like [Tropilaelaps mercedesae]